MKTDSPSHAGGFNWQVIPGIIFCLAAQLILPCGVYGRSQAPEAVIEETKHDFGEVFTGEELSWVFTVRNNGSSPLEMAPVNAQGRLDNPKSMGRYESRVAGISRPAGLYSAGAPRAAGIAASPV